MWVKSSLSDALQTALSALKNITSPLSTLEVQYIVSSTIAPSSSQALSLTTKVNVIETSLSTHLPRLYSLYSVCSGGVTKQPAEALAARLIKLSTKISTLEHHVYLSSSSSFGLGNVSVPPLTSLSISEYGVVKTVTLYKQRCRLSRISLLLFQLWRFSTSYPLR